MHFVLIVFFAALLACGCTTTVAAKSSVQGADPTSTVWQQSKPAPVPTECKANDEMLRRATHVFDTTSACVHEMVTCCGLQVSIAQSLMIAIVKSNPETLTPALVAQLGGTPTDKLSHAADGSWTTGMANFPGSIFTVRFYEPDGKKLIQDNLFQLSSYLQGVKVTHDMSADDMVADPTAKATYTFAWSSLGPLGHLLADGNTPPNPIILKLSALDVLNLSQLGLPADRLGAFGSLLKLQMAANAAIVSSEGGAAVNLELPAISASLGIIATKGAIDIGSAKLVAGDGIDRVDVLEQDLHYADKKGLRGHVTFGISGSGLSAKVQSDFGDGALYPKDTWLCP